MPGRLRGQLLVLIAICGSMLTGFVVWITSPAPPADPLAVQLDAASVDEDRILGMAQGVELGEAEGTPHRSPLVGVEPCARAPVERRAAQTLVVGIPGVTDPEDPLVEEVLALGVGGIFLSEGNVVSRSQVMRLTRGIRGIAQRPIVIAVDEEPGRVSTFRDLLGPSRSARRMAAEDTASDVRDHALEVATELARLGIDVNLAPVVDLTDGWYGGIIGDRSFSADPDTASEYARAYAEGMVAGGVLPVAKHFPGQGRSTTDLHVTASTPLATPLGLLQATDLRPFRDLVRAGIPVVMTNHLRYGALDPKLPASLAPEAYELLRDMGFEGVAITDSVGMGAVNRHWGFYFAPAMAVAAGADGVLGTSAIFAEEMRDGMVNAVEEGSLPEHRLDEAASRMLAFAGGDPTELACLDLDLPTMRPAPQPPSAIGPPHDR